MNNSGVIKKAVGADLNELFELEQICFDAESFSRRQLHYLITQAKADFLLTRNEGEISSFLVLLNRKNSSGMRIYSIAVSPKYRGKGLAQQLLNQAVLLAKNAKKKFLTLEVSEINSSAVNLYLKNGFEVFGERKAYYKDGSKALLMRKEV